MVGGHSGHRQERAISDEGIGTATGDRRTALTPERKRFSREGNEIMVIFKKAIPRRKFLRGVGATIALPLLDAMVPALARAQSFKSPIRLGTVYVPNGMWPMEKWTPISVGALDLSETLEPLTP